MPSKRLGNQVFISYSHTDDKWLDLLVIYLTPLTLDRLLRVWSDRELKLGSVWETEIEHAMERSAILVLLVSAEALASSFVWQRELAHFLQAAERGEVTILWIAVSSSSYQRTPLRLIQCLNDPKKHLTI